MNRKQRRAAKKSGSKLTARMGVKAVASYEIVNSEGKVVTEERVKRDNEQRS